MTLIKRLSSFFTRPTAAPKPADTPVVIPSVSAPRLFHAQQTSTNPLRSIPDSAGTPVTVPYWLADTNTLRDEGVLFGLSDAGPDEKVAEIRAYFSQQAILLQQIAQQHADWIEELDQQSERCESRRNDCQKRLNALHNQQPAAHSLLRTLPGLGLSVLMCVGTFFLIDETLQPIFPNRWIAVGIFLAGMFNLFGRTSFFYENDSRLTGRRLLEEVGLPGAASVFVLAQALQTQSVGQAVALFAFIFFLFLLTGKLLLSTLTTVGSDLTTRAANQQLAVDKRQQGPMLETQTDQLNQVMDDLRLQKLPVTTAFHQSEGDLTRLNAQRDQLVNLFLSEFELARSLRDRLSEQQRTAVLRNYNVM